MAQLKKLAKRGLHIDLIAQGSVQPYRCFGQARGTAETAGRAQPMQMFAQQARVVGWLELMQLRGEHRYFVRQQRAQRLQGHPVAADGGQRRYVIERDRRR